MKALAFAVVAAAFLAGANAAYADGVRRGGFNNAAGGVTAGEQVNVGGPFGGRAVGERGVVTNGDGAGIGGGRGCAEGAGGGYGCRRDATARDEDGNLVHGSTGYAEGRFGNSVSSTGGFVRDEDGDITGARNSEITVGDRTYSAESSFDSDDGFDRDVTCTNNC